MTAAVVADGQHPDGVCHSGILNLHALSVLGEVKQQTLVVAAHAGLNVVHVEEC